MKHVTLNIHIREPICIHADICPVDLLNYHRYLRQICVRTNICYSLLAIFAKQDAPDVCIPIFEEQVKTVL